jgi:hypothetical protein
MWRIRTMRRFKGLRWIALAALAAPVVTLTPLVKVAQGNNGAAGVPTLPELTAKWWEWVLSLPVSENPLFDETGEFADNQQPYQNVFFLAGVANVSGTAERTITVPAGTALFVPLLNIEWDNVGVAKNARLNVPGLRAFAAQVMDSAEDLHITLDGDSLLEGVERIQSPPFAYHLPADDNIYGGAVTGTIAPAVSDGYWLYLAPLPKGEHTLNFGGTNVAFNFSLDITYHITVE